ncbi:MAG: AAA family ATPase, partial [Verrucomicrobiota bacterium JB024]|nr:AAA family ATPase [Verrucomicrobiota bacterium JB024]
MSTPAKPIPAPRIKETLDGLRQNIGTVIRGKDEVIRQVVVALVAGGHVLVEDLPGVGKTTLAYCLARSVDCTFSRIQFTSDLLPSDVIGVSIYDDQLKEFVFKKGPIFANIVLADEVNPSPAKVQAALLEAMQERQVTLGETTYPLPSPFLVLATQNPIDQEGTYPLPEAQVDRFMLKLTVDYPTLEEELLVIERSNQPPAKLVPQATAEDILTAQATVRSIKVTDVLMRYIVDLVRATRDPGSVDSTLARTIEVGASPRASIN